MARIVEAQAVPAYCRFFASEARRGLPSSFGARLRLYDGRTGQG